MTRPARVFISYARQDGEAFATALHEKLEKEEPEITLWQDRAKLEGGVGWWRQITNALDTVKFLVLIMTPAAMRSPVARKEWHYARQRGVCIYPVKGVPDNELNFDSLPGWMSKVHFFDLDREWKTFILYLKSPCQVTRVPFMVPDLPEGFIERPILTECLLGQLLDTNRDNPVAITTALRGAGGLGKTTLATALCHHDDIITAFDDGILWTTLGQKPNLQEGLTKLYAALTGERPGFVDEEDAAYHLSEKLQDKNCLIVIDDVWDVANLRPFLRGGTGCTRLITTRNFEIAAEASRVEVDEMTRSEAINMLNARLPMKTTDLGCFGELAERLNHWPLLLELANAALRQRIERGDTLEGAIKYLNRKLDEQGVIAFDQRNAIARNQALTRTIELSLDELDPKERERYQELVIFPEDVEIPLVIAARLWGSDEFETEELIQRFDDLSLLKFSLQNGSFHLHDVLHSYLETILPDASSLHQKLITAWGDAFRLQDTYAWRWLGFHMVEAGRKEQLRSLILDFFWLKAKLEATDVTALASDFGYFTTDSALTLLRGAIRLAAHVLARDKTQLASQLLGRLPDGMQEIKTLRVQASKMQAKIWLIPKEPSLTEPGGPLLFTLTGHTGGVRAVVLSKDGRLAVSGSDDLTLKVWDLDRGTEVRSLTGHTDWIRSVAISPDNRWVISTGDDQTVRVWDIENGALLRVFEVPGDWPKTLAVTPDSQYILVGGDSRNIQVLNLEGGGITRTLKGHDGTVNAIVVTKNSNYAISASDDRTLRIWDLIQGTEIQTLRGHTAKILDLAIAPDDDFVVSGSRDDTLRFWLIQNSEGLLEQTSGRLVTNKASWVRAIALVPDGRHVITGSDDCSLKSWDVNTGTQMHIFEGHADWINALDVTSDGNKIISASNDCTLKVWDLKSSEKQSERKGHKERVRMLSSTADGHFAVSTSDDHKMRIWNLKDRSEFRVARDLGHWPVVLSPDGGFIVSAAGDATLAIIDFATGNVRQILTGHTDRIRALTITANAHYVISASEDRTIRIWDLESREVKLIINIPHRHWVRALSVTHDGKFLVSGSEDRTLKLWNLQDGSEIRTFWRHNARINSVVVSHDGRFVISASDDNLIKVWDIDSGIELRALVGHKAKVNTVVLIAEGMYVASVSDDFTLNVWNLITGKLLVTFTGDSPMQACTTGIDGSIVVGDQAGCLHFLQLKVSLE